MSAASGVRPGRSGRGPTVAVTGAAAGVGRQVAGLLVAHPDVAQVVALDDRTGDQPGLHGATSRLVDVRSPSLVDALAGVDVLVALQPEPAVAGDDEAGLDGPHAPHDYARAAAAVLTAAAASGVRRVVLVTSAMVYGALPDNPVPLDEDAPLRALPDSAVVGDLLEVEALADRSRAARPSLEVTVVRPAPLVGPGVESALTRHFEAPRLLVVRGTRPRWQFCHVDDLASALVLAALGRVEGAVTVGCEGWLEQERVEQLSGLRRIELPATLAFGTAERLHRFGVVHESAADLAYVVHPWVVPSTRLLAAGWRPAYDNETALGQLLEQASTTAGRRAGRRDATLGAAGAAVAVVGTAALVRRARRRRR
ncbi:NAD-dependent epimerase/dehydratase family protein [Motilibacter deserti]|uniref:NAD-dependent epimerase/dehydratase family protein n=1 Tax=Motilibacter deserti TaxID=2714956 RepID=A0ABX0GR06_9ACTN|nr:NAD-dependent epimerase/dehydratase family protein [Motilibacter deserti]